MSSFFDLDNDGRVLDDVFGLASAGTMAGASIAAGPLAPLVAMGTPLALKGGNMFGDVVSDDIQQGGVAAETGAWLGGLAGTAFGGPLGGMVGTAWGSKAGQAASALGGGGIPTIVPGMPGVPQGVLPPGSNDHHAGGVGPIMSLFGGMY